MVRMLKMIVPMMRGMQGSYPFISWKKGKFSKVQGTLLKYRKSLIGGRQSKRNLGSARVRRAIMERLLRELQESDTMSILHLAIESSICQAAL